MSEHTATPWELRFSEVRKWSPEPKPERIFGPDGEPIWVACIGMTNTPEAIANAAFIVKAVNNHDALVEALQSIANNTCCEGCQEAAKVARSALAKVSP